MNNLCVNKQLYSLEIKKVSNMFSAFNMSSGRTFPFSFSFFKEAFV